VSLSFVVTLFKQLHKFSGHNILADPGLVTTPSLMVCEAMATGTKANRKRMNNEKYFCFMESSSVKKNRISRGQYHQFRDE